MKRVIAITMLILLTLALCGYTKAGDATNRLRTVDKGNTYEILVDTLTGVQYLRGCNIYGHTTVGGGGVCVMVDAEGKPLIWEGAE